MASLDGCDPAMLELFRAEMDAHLPVLSEGLLALEKGGADEKNLEAMMRAAHSIKGAARIVGIEAAVRVAHALEDCFSAAQGHRITLSSESVDVLLHGVDALQRICAPQPDAGADDGSWQALLHRIKTVKDGTHGVPPDQPTQERPTLPLVVREAVSSVVPPETCLTLPAALDDGAAESLRSRLLESLRSRALRVRLDFSQVGHLSTAGLSLLASFAREVGRIDPPPVVQADGVSEVMALLLRATGLDRTFKPGR